MKMFRIILFSILFTLPSFSYEQPFGYSKHRFGGRLHVTHTTLVPSIGGSISTFGYKSAWLTLGSNPYFIYEIGYRGDRSEAVYYPGLVLNSTKAWNHIKVDEEERYLVWGVGAGIYIRHTAIHSTVGLNRINVRSVYIDPSRRLSSTSFYSISSPQRGFVSLNIGSIFRLRTRFRIKTDVRIIPDLDFILGVGYKLVR